MKGKRVPDKIDNNINEKKHLNSVEDFILKKHKNIYPKLKKEFIDTGLVKIEFRHFPLDMAAFNASKIAQCSNNGKSDLLHFLFSNQKK